MKWILADSPEKDPQVSTQYSISLPDRGDTDADRRAQQSNVLGSRGEQQHRTKRQMMKNGKPGTKRGIMEDMNFSTSVWTTSNMNKMLGNNESANIEFQYLTPSTPSATSPNNSSDGNNTLRHLQRTQSQNNKNIMANNSTIKLLPDDENDDKPCKQSKCSAVRSIIFCICLNVTYANIFRFPREYQKFGIVFLIPYFALLLVVGLPLVLFEVSIGQFLGQGAAHTWRAAPFFKGANVVSRIGSWLIAIYNSMHGALAFLYVGYLIFEEVPFKLCSNAYRNNLKDTKSGQECLKLTFLTSILSNASYFGLLSLALVVIWLVTMVATHSGKILRRAIYFFGVIGLSLLLLETGWDIAKSVDKNLIPTVLPAEYGILADSSLWFSALVQVVFSTQVGIGAIPVLTGKFLYKGDAVKTSLIYVIFNVVVCLVALTFFIFQFNNRFQNAETYYPELVTMTAIYDKAKIEDDHLLKRLVPGLMYLVDIVACTITCLINIYATSRVFRRHRNYVLSICGLVMAVLLMLAPNFLVARLLDVRLVGPFVICGVAVEMIGLIWVYGVKNIRQDLSFSIGRSISNLWLVIWILIPLGLVGIVIWWMITTSSETQGLLADQVPRWVPVLVSMGIIVIVACVVVSKQVDYNFFAMIRGANKPTKDWGPADPLVRHAWKQWTSKCEDTGERDFTLRRRGTKDYTNSIKRGQYPPRYGARNTSTQGSNSPNYSGSVFGDSAIEEDMSLNLEKFHGIGGGYNKINNSTLTRQGKGIGIHSSHSFSNEGGRPSQKYGATLNVGGGTLTKMDRGNGYGSGMYESNTLGRKTEGDGGRHTNDFTSRIEIMPRDPPNITINSDHRTSSSRPFSAYQDNYNVFNIRNHNSGASISVIGNGEGGHAMGSDLSARGNFKSSGWRKYSANSEEFSTEL